MNYLMRAPWVLLMLALLAVGGYGQTQVTARSDYFQVAANLERLIDHEVTGKELPAFSIALVDDQQIVWAQGFGFADPAKRIAATAETEYRVGSVSKLFTDIGIMQLVERGELDLDVPVTRYLPDFHPKNPFGTPITLRELMTHHAGLVREPPVGSYFDSSQPPLASVVKSLNDTDLVYAPGTHEKYSNAGVSVAGYVLERLKGEPYQQYLQHAVLQPMGLRESSFTPAPALTRNLAKSFMWTYDGRVFPAPTFELGTGPAGNMYSTVTDLGRFLSVLFAGGRGAKGTVIKAETLEKMYAPQYSDSSKFSGYGLGFALLGLNDHRVIAHRGGVYGFSTQVLGMPDDHLGVITVTNMDSSSEVTWHVGYTALKFMLAVREHKPLPLLHLTTEIPEETKRRLAGHYGEGEKAVEILDRSGKLYIESLGDGQRTELRQLDDHLVTDDRNGWGWELIPALNAIKTIGYTEDTLNRVPGSQAAPVPQEWRNLLGEYGWDYDTQYLGDRNGALTLLMEWMEYIPLKKISGDVWEFPESSSYDHEKLTFVRDQSGCPTQFKVGGVSFPRRTPCHGSARQLSRDSDLFK